MPLPAFSVEIAADPSTTGLFVLDTSTVGGAHTVAADQRWVEVPDTDVRQVSVRRGRQREDQNVDPGECTVLLDGYSGNYDPDNTSTTYKLNGEVLLRQGVGLRVKVTIGASDYTLFTGVLEDARVDHGRDPVVTWTAVDMLARLGQMSFPPVALGRGGELSSARAEWLLDYAAVPDAQQSVTAGTRTLVPTEGGGTVLSNLEGVARSEQGRVYATRLDVVKVTQHWEEYSKTSAVTFSDTGSSTVDFESIEVEPGAKQVVNSARVVRTVKTVRDDGVNSVDTTFTSEAPQSVEQYGRRHLNGGQPIEVFLESDAEAQALADHLATVRAIPASRVSSVTANLGGLGNTQLVDVAELDLGDRMTIERTTVDGRSLSWDVFVEGISHTASPMSWDVTLATAPVAIEYLGGTPFSLDRSTVSGSDVIAFY